MYVQREAFSSNLPDIVAAAVKAAGELGPNLTEERGSGLPLDLAAARFDRAAGLRLFPDRFLLAAKVHDGEITDADLAEAIARTNAPGVTVADLRAALDQAPAAPRPVPTLADLAAEATGIAWPEIAAQSLGAWAEGHFGRDRTAWGEAGDGTAWASWRDWAMHDLTPEICGLDGFAELAGRTDRDPWRALGEACLALGIDPQAAPSLFERLLCDIWSWTGPAQERAAPSPDTVAQLLAIRLVWEQALRERFGDTVGEGWRTALDRHRQPVIPDRDHLIDTILQSAAACASARALDGHLRVIAPGQAELPTAQLVFTSDARSERFRRAVEGLAPDLHTFGVGDAFGLPAEIGILDGAPAPANPDNLPALLSDCQTQGDWMRRAIDRISNAFVSGFAVVQASGLVRIGALVRRSLGEQFTIIRLGRTPRIDIPPASPEAADIAETALRRIGLTRGLAPLVVFVARQSRTWNGPDAETGRSTRHARALAQLLNETPVREALAKRGIAIDPKCVFMAGAHDTVSDSVNLYTCDPIGGRYPQSLKRLRRNLERASSLVRAERALDLPGAQRTEDLVLRGGDWAEVHPEAPAGACRWFVIGPRRLTAGANLAGAAALHDYEASRDPDGETLADILATEVLPAALAARENYLAALAPDLFAARAPDDPALPPNVPAKGQAALPQARLVVRVAASREQLDRALERVPGLAALQRAGWVELAPDAGGRAPRLTTIPRSTRVHPPGA